MNTEKSELIGYVRKNIPSERAVEILTGALVEMSQVSSSGYSRKKRDDLIMASLKRALR